MEAVAKLRNNTIAPRKMQLVADSIRGKRVFAALNNLKFTSKAGSPYMEKLLLSAINNWEAKNEGVSIEEADLVVKSVFVTQGRTLKRFQPAPQGRAHRIRKRSCHVTLVVDALNQQVPAVESNEEVEQNQSEETTA